MEISRISRQKKNKERLNIYIKKDGQEQFGFGVHDDIFIRYALRKGMTLSDEEITEIQKDDAIYSYYTLAINYLSYRMRAISEMETYLRQKEATGEAIAIVIDRLKQEKLLDDLAFSQAYVQTKMNTTSKGPNKIKQELMQKQIEPKNIEQAMEAYTETIEIEKASKLLSKKLSTSGKDSFQRRLDKAKQSLIQQGFRFESIAIAVEELPIERDETEEEEAIKFQGEKIWQKQSRKYEGYERIQRVKAALYQKGFSSDLIDDFISEKENEVESP